ncbi:hypothetical protein D3C76_939690 [compost metagenome]
MGQQPFADIIEAPVQFRPVSVVGQEAAGIRHVGARDSRHRAADARQFAFKCLAVSAPHVRAATDARELGRRRG